MKSSLHQAPRGQPALLGPVNSKRVRPAFGSATRTSRQNSVSVFAGEKRSANRTNWSRAEQQELLNSNGNGAGSAILTAPAQIETPAPVIDVSEQVWKAADDLVPIFSQIDRLVAANLRKVQRAFKNQRIGPHHFQGSTGYGHGDWGREALDKVMAECMGAEAALMRINFVSGTHAISSALFAVLRPGDEMLAVAGHPYDTLEEVIGLRGTPGHGSLIEWGIKYRELPLKDNGIDYEALATAIVPGKTKVAHIQRSCGYSLRPTLAIDDIEKAIKIIKAQDPNIIVTVDNCYGEFTEDREPCDVGADLCMGSLIKNAGGTIAPGGGYVAGKEKLIGAVAARLMAPGIGIDAGQVSGTTMRILCQGLFLAPQTTGEALKGGRLVAEVLHREGYRVTPAQGMPRTLSMICAIELGTRARMEAFCKGIQRLSPVGSYIEPVPGVTAGYGDEVIFADGTFIDGSTAELSADGPMREPYTVYCQGGTHWTHWAIALESAVAALRDAVAKEN